MRKMFMFNRVSADGYFARPDGSLDWATPDEEIDKEGAEGASATDTVIFGRRTYELLAAFWPTVPYEGATTAPDPHAPGRASKEMRAMAKFLNESLKLVFSKSLKEAKWRNTQIVRDIDPKAIEAMKKKPGKDIIILGSGTIVSQFTELGLIDEYHFVVGPLFIGSGKPLITGMKKTVNLKLLESKKYKSGNLKLRYGLAS